LQGLGKHLKRTFSAILYSDTRVNYLPGRESQQDDEKRAIFNDNVKGSYKKKTKPKTNKNTRSTGREHKSLPHMSTVVWGSAHQVCGHKKMRFTISSLPSGQSVLLYHHAKASSA